MKLNPIDELYRNVDFIRSTIINCLDSAFTLNQQAIPSGLFSHIRAAKQIIVKIMNDEMMSLPVQKKE